MTRKEEIEKESIKYQMSILPVVVGGVAFADEVEIFNINPSFVAGAQWADAHPDKQSIVKYLQEIGYTVTLNGDVITRDQEIKDMEQYVKYQKEKLIEKACEWLERNADKYVASYGFPTYQTGLLIMDFKKAMEGKQ